MKTDSGTEYLIFIQEMNARKEGRKKSQKLGTIVEGPGKEVTLTAQHGGALLEQYYYPERWCQCGVTLRREKQKK